MSLIHLSADHFTSTEHGRPSDGLNGWGRPLEALVVRIVRHCAGGMGKRKHFAFGPRPLSALNLHHYENIVIFVKWLGSNILCRGMH